MVPRSVALFCAAALGASVVSAGLVWALMAMLAGAGIDFFLSWLTTVLLGMLIVPPPIVMLARMLGTHALSRTSTAMKVEAPAILPGAGLVTIAAFTQAHFTLPFLPRLRSEQGLAGKEGARQYHTQ